METKKSNIYTSGGDSGTSSLVGGTRKQGRHTRLEAYGTVDELNCWLGLLDASDAIPSPAHTGLRRAQNLLSSTLAPHWQPRPPAVGNPAPLPQSAVDALEADIDALDSTPAPPQPLHTARGHPDAARAQIARTVARRAERRIIALNAGGITVDPEILRWINRLSDYLFVLARAINIINAHDEIFWEKGC